MRSELKTAFPRYHRSQLVLVKSSGVQARVIKCHSICNRATVTVLGSGRIEIHPLDDLLRLPEKPAVRKARSES